MLSFSLLVSCALLLVFVRYVYVGFSSPLRDLPGPFLARFTKAWYLFAIAQGDFEHVNIRLHQKYGRMISIQSELSD